MRRFFQILILASLTMPFHAYALSSDWQRDEAVGVRLVSGVDGVGQEKTIPLGLELELAPNWHTYWRSPGEAGLPPRIDWQNSETDAGNLQDAILLYPAPKRYTAYGLETIGYRDHVVFPIDAQLRAPGHALSIDASLDLLVCSAICVPKNFTLKLTVPAGAAGESAEAGLIRQFRDLIPGDAEKSGLVLQSVANDGQNLKFVVQSSDALQDPDIFIEDDKNISFAAPLITAKPDQNSVTFKVKPADMLPAGVALAGMPLTITVVNGDHALEQHVVAPPAISAPPPVKPPPLPLVLAVLFGIVGGFILNLMPCVLPVLSLKVLSAVGHGGGETRFVRQSFLVTASGIFFSFLLLAGMTIFLKELGLELGWGVQFQHPVFLITLIFLLTFFAANLWGLFEIPLPRWLADNLDGSSYHPKLASDFAAGTFATLLATPCSAPFLGTAIGFALASGPLDILIVFASLGFGMILPYLAIALFPRLATSLPKPGSWMITLRHLLGLALAATAIWLVWVLAAQVTPRFAACVGFCMTGIVILLALRKTAVSPRLIKIGLIVFAAVALALTLGGSLMPRGEAEVDTHWLPFNETEIAADVDEGKVVFVDVTADWCLTCKANKKFVLSQGDVARRLFHSDVIAMQADWTNPDPVIAAFLQKYGRYGIPFNAVFGPGAPQGIVLPELLTPSRVNEALDEAVKPAP